jgi:pyruvate ferredoxin oxidoreductase delta subunit
LSLEKPSWRELPQGAVPYMSSAEYETGDWGVSNPSIDLSRCTRCTLCHFYCPEGAIRMGEDGYPHVDLRYCKGCGVCAEECPVKCIRMVEKT